MSNDLKQQLPSVLWSIIWSPSSLLYCWQLHYQHSHKAIFSCSRKLFSMKTLWKNTQHDLIYTAAVSNWLVKPLAERVSPMFPTEVDRDKHRHRCSRCLPGSLIHKFRPQSMVIQTCWWINQNFFIGGPPKSGSDSSPVFVEPLLRSSSSWVPWRSSRGTVLLT